jgi:hypothetical protein
MLFFRFRFGVVEASIAFALSAETDPEQGWHSTAPETAGTDSDIEMSNRRPIKSPPVLDTATGTTQRT